MNDIALFGLSKDHLVQVDQHHWLTSETKTAFEHMQAAAQRDGIDLAIASSFRSFERQLLIWNEKWQGKRPAKTPDGDPLAVSNASETEKLEAILAWSALPGTSRHHWGTDLDVYDKASCKARNHKLTLEPFEYQRGGPCAALSDWLDTHASDFGFYRPFSTGVGDISPEPWHVSHKQTARQCSHAVSKERLMAVLEKADIDGKAIIFDRLDDIFARFVTPYSEADNE